LVVAPLALCGCVVVEDYGADTVFGFNTSGIYDESESYGILNLCSADLKPTKVTETNDTATFIGTVSGEFTTAAGWSYTVSNNRLSNGALRIKTYDVQGTSTRVGAEFHVHYRPGTGDPTTNLHWIQVIDTNHSLRAPAGHGNSAVYVDARPGFATTPYYDDGYAADADDLYDFPGRTDAGATHRWEATTYLVQGPAPGGSPGAITIYKPGFRWGWTNKCRPIFDFPWFVFELREPLVFDVEPRFKPRVVCGLKAKATDMVLRKGDTKSTIRMLSADLQVEVGEKIDAGGYYPLTVKRGEIKFGAYEFGDDKHGPSTATVVSGSGYYHAESGESSLELNTVIKAEGQKGMKVVFTGAAKADNEKKTFTFQADTKGVERREEKK
jgi:hypothetical protein